MLYTWTLHYMLIQVLSFPLFIELFAHVYPSWADNRMRPSVSFSNYNCCRIIFPHISKFELKGNSVFITNAKSEIYFMEVTCTKCKGHCWKIEYSPVFMWYPHHLPCKKVETNIKFPQLLFHIAWQWGIPAWLEWRCKHVSYRRVRVMLSFFICVPSVAHKLIPALAKSRPWKTSYLPSMSVLFWVFLVMFSCWQWSPWSL